ncbi:Hsp70 family protein [Paractinoplanes hotanensis]|uniref:Hsp70 family protein n=1 Tax=Paractinoplanes hotanensis TaxID=2906497 RepID=A0ABT0XWV3_9ACTN|nr:Hsp70 family protein [Actinoplanes hotanensis]MCM4078249.1 Hsp70 family protein [Actinoplanes hotanensis]
MATDDHLHLSIYLGARWTAAVASVGSRTWPVTFDGQTRIPSGVWIDPQTGSATVAASGLAAAASRPDGYIPDPLTVMRITPDDADTRPLTAVTELLAYVANTTSAQAGSAVAALTVTTPQPWGPKSRQRLAHAATAAGLPEPAIVTTAAAAAAVAPGELENQAGRLVLVCAIGDDFPHLTVLDTANQYTQLAATTARDPDVPGIDHALAATTRQRLGVEDTSDGLDWQTTAEISRARTALAGIARTPVLLPGHTDPVVLERADLAKASQPHLDRIAPALRQALDDAAIDQADIAATVLVADDATVSAAEAALTDAGLTPRTNLTQPDQLASGAARLTRATHPSAGPTAATTRLPRARLTVSSLTAVVVLAAASVALLLQTVSTADISTISTIIVGVRLPVSQLALAAVLAATAVVAAAQLAPTTWLSPQGMNDTASTGYLLRRSYLGAAAAGLALAGLWGLGTGVGVGWTDPAYLRWTLTAATPIAACAVVTAAVSPRVPAARLGDWLPRMRPPVWPIAVAAAGVYLVRSAYTLTFPTNLTGFPALTASVGAALLGAATAATVTHRLGIRLALGFILVPGYALVVSVNTIGYLTATYVAALLWWHLAATARTVREAAPDNFITRWLTEI